MSTTETWTILRLLDWTETFLKDQGSESARLEAEVLLATARNCKRIDLYTAFDEVATDETRTAFRELVRRRGEGTPVAYLVGHREFFSRKFRVTPDVLIPRPETEFMIIELLDRVPNKSDSVRIADVGTGSGILAVTACAELSSAKVKAIDISPAALKVAAKNAADHGVADRIEFVSGDLLEGVDQSFQFVLSNPPYVSQPEYEDLDKQVKDYEPATALIGGPTGTEIIARLIPQAAQRLDPGGWLMMEISPMIADAVVKLVEDNGSYTNISVRKDLAQHARVVIAQRS